MSLPFLPALLLSSVFLAVLPFAATFLRIGWIRRTAQKILPKGGDGPSLEDRLKGKFEYQIVGTAETEPYDNPIKVRGYVKGKIKC